MTPIEMTITPAIGLIDEPLRVLVRHLPPGVEVTVAARLQDERGTLWSSRATYRADTDGAVDLSRQAPVSGSYAGTDEDGLVTSLRIAAGLPGRTFDNSSVAPLTIDFIAEIGDRQIAAATARRLYVASDVRVTTLREAGLSGLFFQPSTLEPMPGVLVLGGSSGKLHFASQVAALLASRGFPSLALAYFGADGLPADLVEIPLSYFASAMRWLTSQEGICADALGLVGRSRGAELALLLGSRFPLIRSVVAYCPSSIVWNGLRGDRPVDRPAWTASEGAIPFASMMATDLADLRSRTFRVSPVALTPLFEAALDRPVVAEASIPVERINGPILLISGDDDRMWPSARMGDQIVERLAARRHPFPFHHHRYAQAGHLLRTPGVPTTVLHNIFDFGGAGPAQAAANRAAWKDTLAFLRTSLNMHSEPGQRAAIGVRR